MKRFKSRLNQEEPIWTGAGNLSSLLDMLSSGCLLEVRMTSSPIPGQAGYENLGF